MFVYISMGKILISNIHTPTFAYTVTQSHHADPSQSFWLPCASIICCLPIGLYSLLHYHRAKSALGKPIELNIYSLFINYTVFINFGYYIATKSLSQTFLRPKSYFDQNLTSTTNRYENLKNSRSTEGDIKKSK